MSSFDFIEKNVELSHIYQSVHLNIYAYILLYLLNLYIMISAAFNWSLAFLVTEFYLPVSKQVGIATTYWFFASVLLMVMAFTVFIIPEVSIVLYSSR